MIRRWRGTRRATRTCPARCSTAASPRRPIRTCRARSTSFARRARPARRGTSRPVRSLSSTTRRRPATELLDKQLLTVDATKGSPFQDRIYVTWTLFAADGTSYIYEANSRDYGEHFSAPKLVSTDSALCTNDLGVPTPQGRCNTNQFSQPFTGPDGALYVVWDNFNLTGVRPGEGDDEGGGDSARSNAAPQGVDNRSQVLLAKSTDGGNTFSAPVKVADYYDLPDCATYQDGQDPGRACVPEKGETANSIFRATNYPSGAVNPRDPKRDRHHVRLLHQPPLQRGQRLRPAGLQSRHVPAALRRCQDGGRVQ